MRKKKSKNKYVAITQCAYDALESLIVKMPKEDGSTMTLCEMASTIIVRAAKNETNSVC